MHFLLWFSSTGYKKWNEQLTAVTSISGPSSICCASQDDVFERKRETVIIEVPIAEVKQHNIKLGLNRSKNIYWQFLSQSFVTKCSHFNLRTWAVFTRGISVQGLILVGSQSTLHALTSIEVLPLCTTWHHCETQMAWALCS